MSDLLVGALSGDMASLSVVWILALPLVAVAALIGKVRTKK